jgi:hypothetical protein
MSYLYIDPYQYFAVRSFIVSDILKSLQAVPEIKDSGDKLCTVNFIFLKQFNDTPTSAAHHRL